MYNLLLADCTVSPSCDHGLFAFPVDSLPVAVANTVQDEVLVSGHGTDSNTGLSEHSAIPL